MSAVSTSDKRPTHGRGLTLEQLAAKVAIDLRDWATFAQQDDFAPWITKALDAMADEVAGRLLGASLDRIIAP